MSERYNVSINRWDDGATRAHLARYYLARGFLGTSDRVLDVGCGTGYGSFLLSMRGACSVLGVDYSAEAIATAKNIYTTPWTTFKQLDVEREPLPEEKFNVSVAIEVLEHLNDPKAVMEKIAKVTTRLIIYSVPTGEKKGANPFHKQTFTVEQARQLGNIDGWLPFHSFMQGNHFINIIYKK